MEMLNARMETIAGDRTARLHADHLTPQLLETKGCLHLAPGQGSWQVLFVGKNLDWL